MSDEPIPTREFRWEAWGIDAETAELLGYEPGWAGPETVGCVEIESQEWRSDRGWVR